MSILNYIKPKDGLREQPKGPLSQGLSSRSISAANSEVAKVIGAEYNKWVKVNIVWLAIAFGADDQCSPLSFS